MGRYAIVPRNGEPHIFGFGSEVAAEKLYCPWIKDHTFPAHATMHGALPMEWKCYENFLADLDMVLANHQLDKSKVRIGVDLVEAQIILALINGGYTIADGQNVMQHARAIKNEDEIMCLKHGAAIVDAAFHKIAQTIQPGMKENDLAGGGGPRDAPPRRPVGDQRAGHQRQPDPAASASQLGPSDPAGRYDLHGYRHVAERLSHLRLPVLLLRQTDLKKQKGYPQDLPGIPNRWSRGDQAGRDHH